MAMNSSKQLFSEAQAVHEGDRAALLAAINEAANQLGNNKGAGAKGPGPASVAKQSSVMMKNAHVNQAVARDLVSHANSRVADMNDFLANQQKEMSAAE